MFKNANELFTKIEPTELSDNPFSIFAKDWVLITAGDASKFNTMTASWGGIGVIWNKNVATIYVRPQRYTYEFLEANDSFTISVLPEQYREALTFCGKKSGRDCDKVSDCGLTPVAAGETIAFEQARLVLHCKKVYCSDLNPIGFCEESIDTTNYPNKDYHRMYIGEILGLYKKP